MSYRKFRADQLFTGYQLLGKDAVLVTDEQGVVESILPYTEAGDDVERISGILSPGFINCHCHLELSHMKGMIPEKSGMTDFVLAVVQQRQHPGLAEPLAGRANKWSDGFSGRMCMSSAQISTSWSEDNSSGDTH